MKCQFMTNCLTLHSRIFFLSMGSIYEKYTYQFWELVKHVIVAYKLFAIFVISSHPPCKTWTHFFTCCETCASRIQEWRAISCTAMYILKIDLCVVEMQDARVLICPLYLILYSINLHRLSQNMKKVVTNKIEINSNMIYCWSLKLSRKNINKSKIVIIVIIVLIVN